jgi:hypothetical protein
MLQDVEHLQAGGHLGMVVRDSAAAVHTGFGDADADGDGAIGAAEFRAWRGTNARRRDAGGT